MIKIEVLAGPVVLCEEEKQRAAFRKLMYRVMVFWAKRKMTSSAETRATSKRIYRINRKTTNFLLLGFVAELGNTDSFALLDWSLGKRRD